MRPDKNEGQYVLRIVCAVRRTKEEIKEYRHYRGKGEKEHDEAGSQVAIDNRFAGSLLRDHRGGGLRGERHL
jgi:hypothetical protein